MAAVCLFLFLVAPELFAGMGSYYPFPATGGTDAGAGTAPRYGIIDLGTNFFPVAINNSNVVISTNAVWNAGTTNLLAGLTNGPWPAQALGIDDAGEIMGRTLFSYPEPNYDVGNTNLPPSLLETHACYWPSATASAVDLDTQHNDTNSHNGDYWQAYRAGYGDYNSLAIGRNANGFYGISVTYPQDDTAAQFSTGTAPVAAAQTTSLSGILPTGPQTTVTGVSGTNWCGVEWGAFTYIFPEGGSAEQGPIVGGTIYTNAAYTNFYPAAINDSNIVVGNQGTNAVMAVATSSTALAITNLGPGSARALNNATNASGAATPQIVGVDATYTNATLWDQTTLSGTNTVGGVYIQKNLNQLIGGAGDTNTPPWQVQTAVGINNNSAIIGGATYSGTDPAYVAGNNGVMLVPCELAVDADRNGTIVMANDAGNPNNVVSGVQLPVDVTTQTTPFVFWLNDGVDGPDTTSTYSGETTVQVSLNPIPGSLNYEQNEVTCTRDLENFARLWLYIKGLSAAINPTLGSSPITVGLEWHSNTGDATNGWGTNDGAPAINIYAAAPKHGSTTVTGGADYLTDTNAAPNNTETDQANATYGIPLGSVAKGTPFYFDPSTFSGLTDANPKTYFLFEATARGTGRLVVTFNTGSAGHYTKIGEGGAVYMDLKDIKELYERWTVGDGTGPGLFAGGGGSPFPAAIISQDRLPSGITPLQYSSTALGLSVQNDPTVNDYILFVHGWNMVPWQKDAFAETMLKRLYWQGYKGKFGTFEWPTTYSTTAYKVVGDLQSSLSYDDGEYSAWKSAVPLEGLLANLSGNYTVDVLGHSMGNVVTGEALRIAGQAGQSLVNTYVATQAALPGHCYDSTLSGGNLLGFGPGGIYGPTTPNIYNNWMVPTHLAMSSKANFYNVDDYALSFWQLDQELKPDIRVYTYGYSGFDITTVNDDFEKFLIYPFTIPLHLGNASGVLDRYEIMAYASEPRSVALGGISSSVAGFATSVNMATTSIWPSDTFDQTHGGAYSAHIWHSAEFLFTNADMEKYWNFLLSEYGITPNPLP